MAAAIWNHRRKITHTLSYSLFGCLAAYLLSFMLDWILNMALPWFKSLSRVRACVLLYLWKWEQRSINWLFLQAIQHVIDVMFCMQLWPLSRNLQPTTNIFFLHSLLSFSLFALKLLNSLIGRWMFSRDIISHFFCSVQVLSWNFFMFSHLGMTSHSKQLLLNMYADHWINRFGLSIFFSNFGWNISQLIFQVIWSCIFGTIGYTFCRWPRKYPIVVFSFIELVLVQSTNRQKKKRAFLFVLVRP